MEYGYFENFPKNVHLMIKDQTLCGDASDLGDDEGLGDWISSEDPVTCEKCKNVINICKKAKVK